MSDAGETLCGAGTGPALAAQRRYVEGRRQRSKLGLMVPEAFVRSIRDLGYRSNGDAIVELIDNDGIVRHCERSEPIYDRNKRLESLRCARDDGSSSRHHAPKIVHARINPGTVVQIVRA